MENDLGAATPGPWVLTLRSSAQQQKHDKRVQQACHRCNNNISRYCSRGLLLVVMVVVLAEVVGVNQRAATSRGRPVVVVDDDDVILAGMLGYHGDRDARASRRQRIPRRRQRRLKLQCNAHL